MIFYDYKCSKCKSIIEVRHSIKDTPIIMCEKCNIPMKRIITSTTFKLNGSGWYKDGYNKNKGK